jgi:hypothetical protein
VQQNIGNARRCRSLGLEAALTQHLSFGRERLHLGLQGRHVRLFAQARLARVLSIAFAVALLLLLHAPGHTFLFLTIRGAIAAAAGAAAAGSGAAAGVGGGCHCAKFRIRTRTCCGKHSCFVG